MTDNKQTITEHIKPDPTELLLAEAEVLENDPKKLKRNKTAGELVVELGNDYGIGFGVNELGSIEFAHQFENGIGKKWFEKISDYFVKTFKYKDVIANGKTVTAHSKAGNLLMTLALLSGGTVLLWPMKAIEDNRSTLSKKANHLIDYLRGDKASPEEIAARDAEVEKAIACEPKRTWGNLLMGRVIAVATTMIFGQKIMGSERNGKVKDFSENLLTGSIQKENLNGWHQRARLVGVETLYCAISSLVLALSSKLLAKRGMTVHDPELCTAIVHEKLPLNTTGSDNNAECAPCAATKKFSEKPENLPKTLMMHAEKHAEQIQPSH